MAEHTLDTDLAQVAIDYFEDAAFRWHHRLLLIQISGPRWIVGTPDLHVEAADLGSHRVIPLDRDAEWPERIRGEVYAFDPLGDEDRDTLLRAAGRLAAVLGVPAAGPVVPVARQKEWRVADVGSARFNEVLDEADVMNPRNVVRDDCGLYTDPDGDEWLYIEKLAKSDAVSWAEGKRAGGGRDSRLCPVQRDSAGRRRTTLVESLEQFKPEAPADWPFPSGDKVRAAREVFDGVRASGRELTQFHAFWVSKSGVNPRSNVAIEHSLIFDYLQLLMCYDMLDCGNLAGVELMCRRVLLIEKAVRRSPASPDFSGLGKFLLSAYDETGGIIASGFDKYISEFQRDDAQIMKQSRLFAEEVHASRKRDNQQQGEGKGKRGGGGGADAKGDKS